MKTVVPVLRILFCMSFIDYGVITVLLFVT